MHPPPSKSPPQEETLRLIMKVIVLSLCREKWNRLLIVTQRQHKYPYNVIIQCSSTDGPQTTSCIEILLMSNIKTRERNIFENSTGKSDSSPSTATVSTYNTYSMHR